MQTSDGAPKRADWSWLWRPFGSLPSRISLWAFAATLITSLVVTAVSRETTEDFLRDKIDQKFPGILSAISQRLELRYSQGELEIETFARSATVLDNISRIRGRDRGARAEVETYLSYVLERFPQYHALFALDDMGRPLLWAGTELELPESLAKRLASVTDSRISDVYPVEDLRIQVASAQVRSRAGKRVASLHALMSIDDLESTTLDSAQIGTTGRIYVVSRDGSAIMRSPGAPVRARLERPLPANDGETVVADYTGAAGERVIGGALAFDRFGWTIVVEEPAEEAFKPAVEVVGRALGINLVVVALFSVVTFQIARSLVRPIVELSKGARRIAAGETGVTIPVSSRRDEIGVLTHAVNEMSSRLVGQNQQLQRVNEALEQLSITDGLTKLHNHRFFQEHLPREMKRAQRTGEKLCLILIDIDDFKKLNDRYGHAVGDAVLRSVARVMHDQIRGMDLLARYGGEEFALLASHTDLDGARALAEKIRVAVAEARFPLPDHEDRKDIGITVSIGVAQFHGDEKAFFNEADEALYQAKGSGKDCVCVAPPVEDASSDPSGETSDERSSDRSGAA